MAKALTEMLEPGERVLVDIRKPLRPGLLWYPILPLWGGAAALFGFLLVTLAINMIMPWSQAPSLWEVVEGWSSWKAVNEKRFGVLLIFGLIAYHAVSKLPCLWQPYETLLTERRLLYCPAAWRRRVEAIELDDMVQVRRPEVDAVDKIEFVARDETTITLAQGAGAERIAAKIATLRGLTSPMSVGAMSESNSLIAGLVVPASFAVLGLVSVLPIALKMAVSPEWGWIPPELGWIIGFLGLVVIILPIALFGGEVVAILVTIAVMKRRVGAEQMRNWICLGRRRDDRWTRLYLKWASFLYGRPLHYAEC